MVGNDEQRWRSGADKHRKPRGREEEVGKDSHAMNGGTRIYVCLVPN